MPLPWQHIHYRACCLLGEEVPTSQHCKADFELNTKLPSNLGSSFLFYLSFIFDVSLSPKGDHLSMHFNAISDAIFMCINQTR